MNIQFEDYARENKFLFPAALRQFKEVFNLHNDTDNEKYLSAFEAEFAKFNGSKFVIAVNSGTTALELALAAVGIKDGDEVILPSYTYIATGLSVLNLNALPVFADINKDTWTISPGSIQKKITSKTKAIIVVHIHGNPCDVKEVMEISRKHRLPVIEDASHAHGAEYNGVKVGNFGVGCFSCYTNKNFGCFGNAGLITLNNKLLYKAILGSIKISDKPAGRIFHRTPCRMGLFEAAFLKAKLPFLEEINDRKIYLASQYIKRIGALFKVQKSSKNAINVYRDFVILAKDSVRLEALLQKKGIVVRSRYRYPLHRMPCFRDFVNPAAKLPVTDEVSAKALSLPISSFLLDDEVYRICCTLRKFAPLHA